MSDKIGKYYWVRTKTGREIAFKRNSGLWERHGIDCLEDCQESILEVYGEVANETNKQPDTKELALNIASFSVVEKILNPEYMNDIYTWSQIKNAIIEATES